MDSKLLKLAAALSLVTVLLIALIVVRLNRGSVKNPYGQSTPAKETESSAPETVQGKPSLQQVGTDLKAFERDGTFFDAEKNTFLEGLLEQANRLSLFVTSVEKDLRIQVLDIQERAVKGESFQVNLEGVGAFKDVDKDGVIYIGDLDPGDYYVSLSPIEGYRIPENGTRIRVREKVEYVPIEDISLLLRTEDKIDAKAEDTGGREAVWEADDTEMKELQLSSKTVSVGIDVSKWQGDIAWDRVKKAGVEFVIIRAGYRGASTGALVEDPNFKNNMRGAYASGIPMGVYFFSQATNEVEAVEEASAVLQLIRNFQLDYPVFIDTGSAGGGGRADKIDAETRTLVCDAFCRTIQNAGYTAGVYASSNWLQTKMDAGKLEKYSIWLAEYREMPRYEGYYEIWQHTSQGTIDGIVGNVGLNVSYRRKQAD